MLCDGSSENAPEEPPNGGIRSYLPKLEEGLALHLCCNGSKRMNDVKYVGETVADCRERP